MNRIKFFYAAALCSLMAVFAACTADENSLAGQDALPGNGESTIEKIVMTARDFVRGDVGSTRTSVSVSPKGAAFQWIEGDTVGVYPEFGTQVYFAMNDAAGNNTAEFDGGNWALKASARYMAYYPLRGEFYLDKTRIPVTYPAEQTQSGNASTVHACKYDYMTAQASTPEGGSVNFQFDHLGALVELVLHMPKAGEVKQVKLTSDQPWYTTAGTVDLTGVAQGIQTVSQSKTFTINTTDVTTTADGEIVKVYFMMAPCTLQDNAVEVSASGCTATLPAAVLKAGECYSFDLTLEQPKGFTKVEMNCSESGKCKPFTVTGGNPAQTTAKGQKNTWNGSAIPVFEGKASAQNRIRSIVVTYGGQTYTLTTKNTATWTIEKNAKQQDVGYYAVIEGFKVRCQKKGRDFNDPTKNSDHIRVYTDDILTIEYVGPAA